MRKVNHYTNVAKFVIKLPVFIVSIMLGLPIALIRSCILGAIEVSDTIMDMVFDMERIKAEHDREHERFQQMITDNKEAYEQDNVDN